MANWKYKYTRYGVCNPKEKGCNAACCRNLLGQDASCGGSGVFEGEITFEGGLCNKLGANNKCIIYKKRPESCVEWPNSPDDIIYKQVKDVCSYYFVIEKVDLDEPKPENNLSIEDGELVIRDSDGNIKE